MLKYMLLLASLAPLSGKLVIHMDVNRTIYAYDSKQNYSMQDLVNLSLAKKTKDLWDPSLTEPVDFYTYVYQNLHPGERKDRALRKKRRDCVHKFISYLKDTNHPKAHELEALAETAEKKLQEIGNGVFPSFYRLLEYLDGKDYLVIFRTFGGDMEQVKDVLCQEGIPPFEIRHADAMSWEDLPENSGLLACKDNWSVWSSHNEHFSYGKPFPLFKRHTQLFFDDNVEYSNTSNIVAPYLVSNGTSVLPTEAIDEGLVVPVNTYDALMNDQYFVEKIEALIQKAQTEDCAL